MLSEEQAREVQLNGNMMLNPHRNDWLELFSSECMRVGQFDAAAWQNVFDNILAGSDVIRYTSLGNPESILISDERVERALNKRIGLD